jgi:peptidoglycan-N-acetylglucosamine deacetylase
MTRRLFLPLASCMGAPSLLLASRRKPVLAITIDDIRWRHIAEPWGRQAGERLLETLAERRMRAMLFVSGANVDDAEGKALLQRWNDAGHSLANHTYEHRRLGRADSGMPWFGEDLLRCEQLLKGYSRFRKLFRFPTLHEGDTVEQRDGVRAFLRRHGYRNGGVSIDASDWYYDSRLSQRLKADAQFDVKRYEQPYIEHILDRARYYDDMSRQVLGRSVRHTLLIHYNLVNTLFLRQLLQAFEQAGWGFVDAEDAFADGVYRREPKVLPAGQSVLWMLAKETGRFKGPLSYPGESEATEKPKLDRLEM